MSWQPIEAAPKQKTVLLFAVTDIDPETNRTRNWRMGTGYWTDAYTSTTTEHYTDWHWEGRQLKSYDVQPTHWMPLPEPPVTP